MTWPPLHIAMCLLVGITAIAIYVVLLGGKYGWQELRAPEAWAVAVLLGIGFFLIAMLHPSWMPRDMWDSGARRPGAQSSCGTTRSSGSTP